MIYANAGECPGQLFACPKAGAAEKARGGNHRTPKPEALMRRLVEVFTSKGDTILDPFMGSGTTGVAAMDTGRKFVGFELDPQVFATAQQRIKNATPKRVSLKLVGPVVRCIDHDFDDVEMTHYSLQKAA